MRGRDGGLQSIEKTYLYASAGGASSEIASRPWTTRFRPVSLKGLLRRDEPSFTNFNDILVDKAFNDLQSRLASSRKSPSESVRLSSSGIIKMPARRSGFPRQIIR